MACYNPHTNTVGQYNPLHTLNHQGYFFQDAHLSACYEVAHFQGSGSPKEAPYQHYLQTRKITTPIPSMGLVYENLHEWCIFYGKFVGKYTSAMDAMGYIQRIDNCLPLLERKPPLGCTRKLVKG